MSKRFPLSAMAFAAACACLGASADDSATVKDLAQKLEASLRTIEALTKRVEQLELERKKSAPAAVEFRAPGAAELGARVEAVERSVAQAEASSAAASQVDLGLPIHGFADVGGGIRNDAAAGTSQPRGFKVGVFDLYMTPQISSRIKALVEIAFEYDESGVLNVDVERMQLGYAFGDWLTLWGGRFHTPYGYWNTAFHHGAQLQTTIVRPKFLDFEDSGGILPAHSVGVWANGATRTGLGKVGYDFYVINGDRITTGVLDFQARGDSDSNVGYGFRTSLTPAGTSLTVGVHGFDQRVTGENAEGTATGNVKVRMLGGFANYDTDNWEAMLEYYNFRNRDIAGGTGTHASNAWYAQVGYNINEQYTPYVRYESCSLSDADPFFTLQESGKSYRRSVAGVRYNLSPKAALKAEWLRTTGAGTSGTQDSLAIQYSIRF
jgi:hypothetical protein